MSKHVIVSIAHISIDRIVDKYLHADIIDPSVALMKRIVDNDILKLYVGSREYFHSYFYK